MIMGVHPVLESLREGLFIDRVFLKQGIDSVIEKEVRSLCKVHGVSLKSVPIEKINQISRKNHQGIIAFLSSVPLYKIDELILQIFEKGESPTIIFADGITDVRNLGAIARTAYGMGVHALVVPSSHTAPINSDAVKASAGLLLKLKICKSFSTYHDIKRIKNMGLKLIGLTEKGSSFCFETDLKSPVCFILGDEDRGLSTDAMKQCDFLVKLPIDDELDSYNVSVATGMLLYEKKRQEMTN